MATPSLAMVPSGYKDGTLYNVLPNNATGDFDVTRGSLATRVNKNGLIEPVGTLGADVVLNGDFEEVGADQILNGDFSQEGSEEITNGDFATDSDWNKGSGWTISGGSANNDGSTGDLYQSSVLEVGKSYKLDFEITNVTSGTLYLASNKYETQETFSSNGSYSVFIVPKTVNLYFYSLGFNGSIDNVSVVEVGQDWTLFSGWYIGENKVFGDGTTTTFVAQDIASLTGKSLKVTFDILDYVSGTFRIIPTDRADGLDERYSGNGSYEVFYTSTVDFFRFQQQAFNGSITNISLEEVGQNWTLTDGCSITAQGVRITSDGAAQSVQQGGVLVVGDTYEMEYEITESVSGLITMAASFGSGIILKDTLGVHKFYAVATNTTLQLIRNDACDITIDNIKIKRLNGDDTPRIDYTDGGCPVLLTEPQSTNLITQSNDFSDTSWLKESGATIESNIDSSPDGSINASYVKAPVGTNILPRVTSTFSSVAGESYNGSIFIKKDNVDWIRLLSTGATATTVQAYYDISNGVIGNASQSDLATIEDYGNGWYRLGFKIAAVNTTSGATFRIQMADGDGSSIITTDGTEKFLLYGAQLETLSYPTSYIPTYGAVRTRLQDSVTGAGTSSDFNSVEGVLFAEVGALSNEVESKRISLSDGSNNNRVVITLNGPNASMLVRRNGVTEASMAHTVVITDLNKIAVKYKENDFALWVNGVEVGTDNNGLTFPANTFNQLSLADGTSGSSLFGKTSQVQVFKTALSDNELELLTTKDIDYSSYASMAAALNYNIS